MFGISTKRVDRELEAKLRPPNVGNGRGKIERKWYADGSEKLTVRARDLALPDGGALTVCFGDCDVASLEVHNGAGRLHLNSADGNPVPTAEDGQTVRILYRGKAALTGTFLAD